MHNSLLAEAQRQFLICSACRYCEGYCATFPAIEGRTTFTAADVDYIANLCHDCRACSQACMYGAPHEFAVDIPRLLGTARLETYGKRASATTTLAIVVLVLALLLAAIAGSGRCWTSIAAEHVGPGAFYAVVPFLWMLVPALLLSLWALWVLARAAQGLMHDVAPQMRATVQDRLGALYDGLALVYMRGAGAGCYYPEQERPSAARCILHVVLVAGVALAFLATLCAAFMQDVLELLPPYPLSSAPVLLGILGGVCILCGGIGLLALKTKPDARAGAAAGMTALDVTFLMSLLIVAATGLLLLALRTSSAMGSLLVVHLAAVATLFVTAPYGKFMHVPMRLAALLVFRMEESHRCSDQKNTPA